MRMCQRERERESATNGGDNDHASGRFRANGGELRCGIGKRRTGGEIERSDG